MAGPNKPKWRVETRSDWDILYQQSVVYYWNLKDKKKDEKQTHSLYSLYEHMGVVNIEESASDHGVYFTVKTSDLDSLDRSLVGDNEYEKMSATGVSSSGELGGSQRIVKVIPEFENSENSIQSADPKSYQESDSRVNGWLGLRSELNVKIPNRTLLHHNIAQIVDCLAIPPNVIESLEIKDARITDLVDKTQCKQLKQTIKLLLKLDLCCRVLLGNSLVYYYSYLPKAIALKTVKRTGLLTTYLSNVFGSYVADLISIGAAFGIAHESFGTGEEFKDIDQISIPEYLVLVGLLDELNVQWKCLFDKKRTKSDIKFKQFECKLKRIEEQIHIPLSALLSSYVSLGLYFPFGLEIERGTIARPERSLPGLAAILRSAYPTEEEIERDYNIVEIIDSIYHYLTKDSQEVGFSIDSMFEQGEFCFDNWYDKFMDKIKSMVSEINEEPTIRSTDRGGAAGIDGDFAWEYFIPRCIAYNWASLKSARPKDRSEILDDQTHLNDCKALLYSLGFNLPSYLDVKFSLIDNLPFKFTQIECQTGSTLQWNYCDYISELTVAYPDAPSASLRSFALSDLNARRPNQPFTTA